MRNPESGHRVFSKKNVGRHCAPQPLPEEAAKDDPLPLAEEAAEDHPQPVAELEGRQGPGQGPGSLYTSAIRPELVSPNEFIFNLLVNQKAQHSKMLPSIPAW